VHDQLIDLKPHTAAAAAAATSTRQRSICATGVWTAVGGSSISSAAVCWSGRHNLHLLVLAEPLEECCVADWN
jgi:hypothetical protein